MINFECTIFNRYIFELYINICVAIYRKTSLVAQMVKCLPTMQETWVQSLGWADLLEKEMATHSSILARKIPWTEEPGRLKSVGLQRVGQDWAISLYRKDTVEQIPRHSFSHMAPMIQVCPKAEPSPPWIQPSFPNKNNSHISTVCLLLDSYIRDGVQDFKAEMSRKQFILSDQTQGS